MMGMAMIDNKRNSRRLGIILSYCLTVSQVVVNIVYVPILLSGIGRDEYGLYQLIGSMMAYMAIMNGMFSSGVTRYFCKALAEHDDEGARAVLEAARRIYLVVSIVLLIIGTLLVCIYANVYEKSLTSAQLTEGKVMLGVVIVNLIITMNNTISVATITGLEHFAFLKGSQLVVTILQPAAVIAVIKRWPYALSITCVALVLNVAVALIQRVYARGVLGYAPTPNGSEPVLMRELLVFSGGVALVLVADMVFWRTNQLILGYVSGVAEVAIYGIAYQLYSACPPLGTAVSSVFMPEISRHWHGDSDMEAISRLFCKVGRLSSYVLLLVFSGFSIFGKRFIELWAGPEYTSAYLVALILMVCQFVDLSQNLGLTILQVADRYAYRGRVYAIMATVNVLLVLVVAPHYGGLGCAVVSGACLLIANGPIMNWYYWKHVGLDIRLFWNEIARMAIPLLLFCAASYLIWLALGSYIHSWISLACSIVLYSILYTFTAAIFCMNAYEKGLAISIIDRIRGFVRKADSR